MDWDTSKTFPDGDAAELPTDWFLTEYHEDTGEKYDVLTLVIGEGGWEQSVEIAVHAVTKAAIHNAIQQARDHVKPV